MTLHPANAMIRQLKCVLVALVCGVLTCSYLFWREDEPSLQMSLSVTPGCNVEKLKSLDSPLYQSQAMKSQLECRFAKRRELLKKSCTKYHRYFLGPRFRIPPHGSKTNVRKRVSLCRIAKVGSMFWMRVLAKYNIFHRSILNTTGFVSSSDLPQRLYMSTKKYAFVRNPYTRLLSGYVDKIFSVNPTFWKNSGYNALKLIRYKNRTVTRPEQELNATCGTDITFAEYVDFILYQLEGNIPIDNHFVPIHRQCAFCGTEYDYIGKMETFLQDMVYVAGALGVMEHNSTREVVLKEGIHGVDIMFYRNARNLFNGRRKDMEACGVTLSQGVRATWKRWQIRGMISMEIPFPVEANGIGITHTQFYKLGQEAHARSDPNILVQGKHLALREAYGTLTYVAKAKLRTMFHPEFELFDYESTPEFVFGKYEKTKFSFFDHKFD
ncbi:uncharacterized protein LOC124145348 [Haliotis rufescens]|uniref:uncharacterized protein LOC124145348 n=1 Tax=Haliotis rufescens TaxID=6454 RepID=UPI00201F94AD|nr:uncharacterized protein LOC124145348 [Haliotis rufescens]